MNILLEKSRSVTSKFYSFFSNKKYRKHLTNQNFTIIAPTCIGGVLYHRMGMKFFSPTINLWMTEPDFLAFCLNLKDYLSKELDFIESENSYPTAQLGGDGLKYITINFNHYKTAEIANRKWNERKARVNYDKIYIIASDRDGITYENICGYADIHCANKVLFSSKEYPEIPYVHFVKKYKGQACIGKYMLDKNLWTGVIAMEKDFDFVKFLNKSIQG